MIRRQAFNYIAIGLLSAALDIGVLQVLSALSFDYWMATSAGFAVGLVFNYVCHLRITFGRSHSMRSALRYISVVGLNYLLTIGLVSGSVVLWQQPLPGKLVALPLVAILGFTAGRFWIFREND